MDLNGDLHGICEPAMMEQCSFSLDTALIGIRMVEVFVNGAQVSSCKVGFLDLFRVK